MTAGETTDNGNLRASTVVSPRFHLIRLRLFAIDLHLIFVFCCVLSLSFFEPVAYPPILSAMFSCS